MRSKSIQAEFAVTALGLLLTGLQSPALADQMTVRPVPYAQAAVALSGTVSELRIRVGDKALEAAGVRNLRISYRLSGSFEPPTISEASTCSYPSPTVSHAARLAAKSGGRTKAHLVVSYSVTSSEGSTLVQRNVHLLGEDGVTLGAAGTPETLPVEICVLGGEPAPPAFETGVGFTLSASTQRGVRVGPFLGGAVGAVEVPKMYDPSILVRATSATAMPRLVQHLHPQGENDCAATDDAVNAYLNRTITLEVDAEAAAVVYALLEYTQKRADGTETTERHEPLGYPGAPMAARTPGFAASESIPICVY